MGMLTAKLTSWVAWTKPRREVLVPVLGLPLFFALVGFSETSLTSGQITLVWGLAGAYTVLILWSPMALPDKDRVPITWARLRRAAVLVVPSVIGAVSLQATLYRSSSQSSGGGQLLTLSLIVLGGTVGVAAEGALPIDLFPVLRRREIRRVLYVVVAALFLMALNQFWSGLFGDLAQGIGEALGETPLESRDAASYFDAYSPSSLFVVHLVSAGFEELLFRVGVMTLIWALTRRWGWGLVVSAAFFGLYHISLSGISDYFSQAPVTSVVAHFGTGLANGLIYRYRGFTAAVMVHAIGNWLMLMIFF